MSGVIAIAIGVFGVLFVVLLVLLPFYVRQVAVDVRACRHALEAMARAVEAEARERHEAPRSRL